MIKTKFIEKINRFNGLAHPKHWKYTIQLDGLTCIAVNIANNMYLGRKKCLKSRFYM